MQKKYINPKDLFTSSAQIKSNDSLQRGKILKVKPGYNPNSSSIGSIIFALPAALLGITISFGAISGLIMSAFMKKIDRNSESKNQKSANEKRKQDSKQTSK